MRRVGLPRLVSVADLLPFLAVVPAVLGLLWASVVVHEAGHYLLGRCVGVPASDMKIHLGRPSYVALRHGQRWVSPDDEGYIPAFVQHAPSRPAAWSFVTGGFLIETGVVQLLVLALAVQDLRGVALLVLGASSVIFVLSLCSSMPSPPYAAAPQPAMAVRCGASQHRQHSSPSPRSPESG